MSARQVLYLVDGTYTVFRSYYAIAGLRAPDGTPTNGVFGFVNTVRKLVRERLPDHLGVAFDLPGPTHRDEIFAEYKANRAAPPDDLPPQFPLAMDCCRVMQWPILTSVGFEADDVIATLAHQARTRGLDVMIVTSDKDLYQLVGDGISVLNPAKEDRILDPAGVAELFGVRPDQVIDTLALMGDAVDNVPGVPGVGEKTAKGVIQRYGSLDAVLARAADFAAVWKAHDAALAAIETGDEPALRTALGELREPAERLAALERQMGGEAGADLAARFAAAVTIAATPPPLKDRALKKALKDLESKTQPKVWLSLAEHAAEARFSQTLVTVRTDAPVELNWDALAIGAPDAPAAHALFARLGFGSLTSEMAQLAAQAPVAAAASSPARTAGEALDVAILDTSAALADAAAEFRQAPMLAFDTETKGLDPRTADLVGVSLAARADAGAYVPVGHRDAERQVAWDEARAVLKPLLEDPSIPKCGQNCKFDRAALRRAGIVVQGIAFDTLVAALLLDPGRTTSHKLDDLAERYLGERMIAYGDVAGRGEQERTLDQVDVAAVARYAAEDAAIVWRLVPVLRDALQGDDLLELFETIEMPVLPVIEQMEHHGIRVDAAQLARMSAEMDAELTRLQLEIAGLAGRAFNVNSNQQLRQVLFDELKLVPTGRRTQKGKEHSTGQEALEALVGQHPLPAKVLEHRELAKLKGTYVDTLPKLIDPRDGRVHGQFHQLGAATGRLSSSDPNLQNIPVRTALGREIRAAFVPEPGWKFLGADYSQMELRLLAHLSDDPALIEAFNQDIDIHRYTAALVENVDLADVTPEMRSRAKAVNFGIIYGMSEFRLARDQQISREAARRFIDAYFARYERVKDYIDRVIAEVQERGEVRTLYGRVRRFPELLVGTTSRLNRAERDALLRQAVNATVQGTAADIVKRGMIRLAARLQAEGLEARLLLQVHDELLLEAPPGELAQLEPLVREAMEGAAQLAVPLRVETRIADDWAGAH